MLRRIAPEPPIYTFRVRILGGFYAQPDCQQIWREIEVAANQTLEDLGEAIPLAFDFDYPHLWSFFLSGKPWDRATEYALSSEPGARYPRIVAKQGDSPPQYPNLEDEDEDWDEDEE